MRGHCPTQTSGTAICQRWPTTEVLRDKLVLIFLLLAQTAHLSLRTCVLPHTPTEGVAMIFHLTPMLWPGIELKSVQFYFFEGPWLSTLYRLSHHGRNLAQKLRIGKVRNCFRSGNFFSILTFLIFRTPELFFRRIFGASEVPTLFPGIVAGIPKQNFTSSELFVAVVENFFNKVLAGGA